MGQHEISSGWILLGEEAVKESGAHRADPVACSQKPWRCCKQENTSLQATRAHKWNMTEKKKKLLSFLQARIGHTVHGLYAAQRMKNPPWIKVEQRLCQLLARAMHSQCPLSLGVTLEREENLFCLQDGERWKQWDCMAFLFIPCQFLKIWKCLKVIPRHGRKEVVSQQLGEKNTREDLCFHQGVLLFYNGQQCISGVANNKKTMDPSK